MLKNVPKLTFDKNQKLWCLEFARPTSNHEIKKKAKVSVPDKLTCFLQDYWDSKKYSLPLTFDQNEKQLKLPFLLKKKVPKKDQLPQDNLFNFLKEHVEKNTLSDKSENKINLNPQVNLQQ